MENTIGAAGDPQTVYLDFNATTPVAPEVLEAIHHALKDCWGNPSSSHHYGIKAKKVIDEARTNVARMINLDDASDILFTSGGTEANNMVIRSVTTHYSRLCKESGDLPHIITSNMEHDSVKLVLEKLANENILEYTVVNATQASGGTVKCDGITQLVRPNTCLISIMLANNETGIIQPIAEIAKAVKALNCVREPHNRIYFHTDAAQALGKIPVKVKDLGVDYLTIVGHKFYGPRIGALYVKNLDAKETPLYPMIFGGGQERNMRSGTENTGMIAGLGKAASLVAQNVELYSTHMAKIRDYLEDRLTSSSKLGSFCTYVLYVYINVSFINVI
ncbi:Selenocysteine lyase [Trichoplax sp. H2]|nr:Selenocysteine lyase [Trichoplax sp. H2]|eukprot:RDD44252.1 Selenocysteine lyase [Trichoplax sp. H2]